MPPTEGDACRIQRGDACVAPLPLLERALNMYSRGIEPRLLAFALVSLTIIVAAGTACSPAASPETTYGSPAPTSIVNPTPSLKPTVHPLQAAPTPLPAATIAPRAQVATVTVEQVKELIEGEDKPLLFDARIRLSYDSGHIPGAISLPFDELEKRITEIPGDRLAIFYCTGAT